MSDGYIKIDTKIDETGIDKGVASVDKKLKGTEKTTASTGKSFAALGLKVAAVAGALKVAADVVGDLTDAYKTQIKAETQLESAAKNNPYLDSASVNTLKDYASEIQSYTTYGDEELLPMMAKLAAAGRTQDEIMKIMSAATDMAASGAFSLDGAVNNLNKSYGGLSGELGESIPEIKNLSAEQLKNGAAVDLLAGRYKGIAAQVSETTGTAEQLGNAMGDLKEELGAPFEKGLIPVRKFFTELVSGWANSLRAKREYNTATDANAAIETRTASTLETQLKTEKEKLAALNKQHVISKDILKLSDDELAKRYGSREQVNRLLAEEAIEIKDQQDLVKLLSQEANAAKQKERDVKSAGAALADQVAKQKAISDYVAANTEARKKALEQLEAQATAEGRSVTAEERLGVYAQSYVSLVAESNGLITSQSKVATDLLKTTRDISQEVEDQNALREESEALEGSIKEILDSVSAIDTRKESEKMAGQIILLDDYYSQVQESATISAEEKAAIEEEYLAKRKLLLENEKQAVKQEAEDEAKLRQEKTEEILTIANNFASQYASIMSSISSMITKQIEDEAKIKTAALEEQYANGELSAEEYEAKLTEVKKQAAEEQYKVDMWMWSSNILTAIANTALGVSQALASNGVMGIALGALVGVAGAAQLATIIANKPIPPSFSTGGVMGGTSYTGDKNLALMNSKERVLTAQQNAAFERLAYGGSGTGNGDIKIYNSASNDVKATPQITEDGIKIMIEKTVSSQMADGRFNKSYRQMQNNLRGTRYTN